LNHQPTDSSNKLLSQIEEALLRKEDQFQKKNQQQQEIQKKPNRISLQDEDSDEDGMLMMDDQYPHRQ
jgi:hypothetical protein